MNARQPVKQTKHVSQFLQYTHGWNSSIWRRIHRIIFYFNRAMGKPILLPFWVPVSRLLYSRHFLLPNIHSDGLLSTMRRSEYQISVYFKFIL